MSDLKAKLKAGASRFRKTIPFKNPYEEGGTLFGEQVHLRMMSAQEGDDYQASRATMVMEYQGKKAHGRATPNLKNIRARFAVLVLSDENGNRIFEDNEAAEVGQWPFPVLDAIYEQGLKHNYMSEEAETVAEKNSNKTVS